MMNAAKTCASILLMCGEVPARDVKTAVQPPAGPQPRWAVAVFFGSWWNVSPWCPHAVRGLWWGLRLGAVLSVVLHWGWEGLSCPFFVFSGPCFQLTLFVVVRHSAQPPCSLFLRSDGSRWHWTGEGGGGLFSNLEA